MYLVFTRMPSESCSRRRGSLLLCLCDIIRALITSLVCWFCTGALGLVLLHIVSFLWLDIISERYQSAVWQICCCSSSFWCCCCCCCCEFICLRVAGLGTLSAWCDVDFYPNGGQQQPGCPKPVSHALTDIVTLKVNGRVERWVLTLNPQQ